MRRDFLGDALDFWKGAVLGRLQGERLTTGLWVDPMFSDPEAWSAGDKATYARLLNVDPERLVPHKVTLGLRDDYFAELESHAGDIFLDPDTGVWTGKGKATVRHIAPKEIECLLAATSGRLVIVYQHNARSSMPVRVAEVTASVRRVSRCAWASYESSTVAMLFLSRDPRRPRRVARYLKTLLGARASRRVRNG